jgi:hypothetical protein
MPTLQTDTWHGGQHTVHSARAALRRERPLVRVRSIDRFVTGVTTGLAGVIELSTLAGLERGTSHVGG